LILEREQRTNKKLSERKSKLKHKKGSSEKILQSCINIVKKDILRRKSILSRYFPNFSSSNSNTFRGGVSTTQQAQEEVDFTEFTPMDK